MSFLARPPQVLFITFYHPIYHIYILKIKKHFIFFILYILHSSCQITRLKPLTTILWDMQSLLGFFSILFFFFPHWFSFYAVQYLFLSPPSLSFPDWKVLVCFGQAWTSDVTPCDLTNWGHRALQNLLKCVNAKKIIKL